MTTSVQSTGAVIDYTAGSAISSGDVIVMGSSSLTDGVTVGIALTDIANGDVGAVAIGGVHTMTKVSAAAITQGDVVNWDLSLLAVEDSLSAAASGDVEGFGVAVESKAATTTTVAVLLLPGLGLKKA